MKKLASIVFLVIETICFPLTIIAAGWSRFITAGGLQRTLLAEKIFVFFGVLPVKDHYYQPLINPKKHLKVSLRQERALPGIDFNLSGQTALLSKFNYQSELVKFPMEGDGGQSGFYYNNNSFESGDAEFLYCIIRHFKPRRIVEIGSGFSTLIAIEAVKANQADDLSYSVQHQCIEPFEQPWLEKTQATIIRKKVEDLEIELFKSLKENDILFIDSSHIIRPQGDVLFEFLQILPVLAPGVLVHVHDIFSPRDYLDDWIMKDHLLWNEQYLLEAFLSLNKDYQILGALNYLAHHSRETLASKCPVFGKQLGREPGSFWITRRKP